MPIRAIPSTPKQPKPLLLLWALLCVLVLQQVAFALSSARPDRPEASPDDFSKALESLVGKLLPSSEDRQAKQELLRRVTAAAQKGADTLREPPTGLQARNCDWSASARWVGGGPRLGLPGVGAMGDRSLLYIHQIAARPFTPS